MFAFCVMHFVSVHFVSRSVHVLRVVRCNVLRVVRCNVLRVVRCNVVHLVSIVCPVCMWSQIHARELPVLLDKTTLLRLALDLVFLAAAAISRNS